MGDPDGHKRDQHHDHADQRHDLSPQGRSPRFHPAGAPPVVPVQRGLLPGAQLEARKQFFRNELRDQRSDDANDAFIKNVQQEIPAQLGRKRAERPRVIQLLRDGPAEPLAEFHAV